MNDRELLMKIRESYKEAGNLRALAKRWGVTAQYLCDILHGRRHPGPKILRHFGLKKRTTYCYSMMTLEK